MKKWILLLALLMTVIPVKSATLQEKVANISGAMFVVNDTGMSFECSGFLFEKVNKGYLFATAAHCAQTDAGTDFSIRKVSLSEDEGAPFYDAYMVDVSKTDDIAVYDIDIDKDIELLPLGDENNSKPGDSIINSSYILDSGKLTYYGRFVAPKFIHKSPLDDVPNWSHDMPIDIECAPGSSGSVLVDANTGTIIGSVVGSLSAPNDPTQMDIAMPVSRLKVFRSTIWDKQSMEAIAPPKTIDTATIKSLFGPEHPFTLTVHGPDPVFTQNGYTFKVDILGYELSPDYYYAVPVYINFNDRGELRLISTKAPFYNVGLTILQ